MVYRFTILSDENDIFLRVIEINADATFFQLHEAILKSVNYSPDQLTSFFLCADNWEREQEITLMEMDVASEYDNLVMDSTILEDYITDEGQRLQYVFDMMFERAFFIELREIITGKSQPNAKCVLSKGEPPVQTTEFEALDERLSARIAATNHHFEDDFYDDDEFGMDSYDEEDLENLSEGNPFDDF